jgi:predicted Fe-Mo cluster-binding NifX family protein
VRVAVATENGAVSEHFGHSRSFTMAEVENKEVRSRSLVTAPEHAPGRLPLFLREQGAEAVITCSMGRKAQTILEHFGVEVLLGVTGEVDEVLERFAAGELVPGENGCSHGHGHEHGHGEEHGHRHGGRGHAASQEETR